MTHEQKELLLKDLCARLPYGVKILVQSWDEREMEYIDRVDVLYSVNGDEYIKSTNEDYDFCLEEVKPYLFPLSSMTEKQMDELLHLRDQQYFVLREYTGTYKDSIPHCIGERNVIDWCYKNHFDIHELIPMGLADDATGLDIY